MKHSPYLNQCLEDRRSIIRKARACLQDIKFEAFACAGVSGLLIAPILAHVMNKRIAVVRKEYEMHRGVSHADTLLETNMLPNDRFIFIDDLVASGNTCERVLAEMSQRAVGRYLGRYLYNDNSYMGKRK